MRLSRVLISSKLQSSAEYGPYLHIQKPSCKAQVLCFQARDSYVVCCWNQPSDFEDLLPNNPIPAQSSLMVSAFRASELSAEEQDLHMLSDISNALKFLEGFHTTELENVDIGLLPLCKCCT
jgi:hypothetical protein